MAETSTQNRAAFLTTEKGPFIAQDTETSAPGANEVLIRVHACAIQPADAKVAKHAIFPMSYPAVIGSPVAGVVEALGTGVTKVRVGDRVVSGTKMFVTKKPENGGLQRFSIVDEREVIATGDALPFTKAVTIASYTPPSALFGPSSVLGLTRPSIPPSPLPESEAGQKVLIWGGSSAMGALSISYAKAAGYTVISTASPHNFSIVKNAGADHVFDYHDPETVEKIRKLMPIGYFFDCVGLKQSITSIVKILAPDWKEGVKGSKGENVPKTPILTLLPLSFIGLTESDFPAGISVHMHRFSTGAAENKEWAEYFLAKDGFMEKAFKDGGVLKGVPANVLGGLEKVGEGIEMLERGVSGMKVVVEPWA